MNRRRLVQLEMLFRKLPQIVVRPLLLSSIIRIGNSKSPGIHVGTLNTVGPVQMDVFPAELANVMMQETRTLRNEYQVMAGMSMHLHRGETFISHRPRARIGWENFLSFI